MCQRCGAVAPFEAPIFMDEDPFADEGALIVERLERYDEHKAPPAKSDTADAEDFADTKSSAAVDIFEAAELATVILTRAAEPIPQLAMPFGAAHSSRSRLPVRLTIAQQIIAYIPELLADREQLAMTLVALTDVGLMKPPLAHVASAAAGPLTLKHVV